MLKAVLWQLCVHWSCLHCYRRQPKAIREECNRATKLQPLHWCTGRYNIIHSAYRVGMLTGDCKGLCNGYGVCCPCSFPVFDSDNSVALKCLQFSARGSVTLLVIIRVAYQIMAVHGCVVVTFRRNCVLSIKQLQGVNGFGGSKCRASASVFQMVPCKPWNSVAVVTELSWHKTI